MTTLFTNIFNEFLSTEVDSVTLATKYNQPQLSNYLSTLLKRSREEFYSFAIANSGATIPKMQDCVEFWNQEYTFTNVSSTPTFTTTLSSIPNSGSSFYVTLNGVSTTNYTYNTSTGSISVTISSTPTTVDIIAWIDGQFNQTLSLVETGIIVDLMGLIYLKDKIKQERLINQAIYGKDDGMYSQAQHLKSLNDIYNANRKDIYQRIYVYTYQSDPNKLSGLGGKG